MSNDGKTVRRPGGEAGDGAIRFVARRRRVPGQVKVTEKSYKTAAIPKLLDILVVEGRSSRSARQGASARSPIERKADYGLGLKANQGPLREAVELFVIEQEGRNFADMTIS